MRIAAVLLAGLLVGTSTQASHSWGVQIGSMRCGRNLVTVGDEGYLLLDRCGEPDYRNTVSLVKLSDQLGGFDSNVFRSIELSAYQVTEEWVYKQGPGRLTKILTVTGGVLTDIRVARRQ